MATVAATILKSDKKTDGTWNVKIRVWHDGKPAYIDTTHFVGRKQLGKKNKDSDTLVIKDQFILDLLAPVLKNYRDWISIHSSEIKTMTAQQLRDALEDSDKPKVKKAKGIDFIQFCTDLFYKMRMAGKESSTRPLVTVVNSLKDYFKSESVDIEEINYAFLTEYESYLKSPRQIVRENGDKKQRDTINEGLKPAGLHNHMRDLRGLFNKAREHYNDEDKNIIKINHYPFKKYKVGKAPLSEKRTRPISEIVTIRDVQFPQRHRKKGVFLRDELARDLFMLSFYMLGMNAADMFELPDPDKIGVRYNYSRSKTRDRRNDNAFISVLVVPEARVILNKYAGTLQKQYSSEANLNKAIDFGLKMVSQETGIPNIDFYDARHCVGDWARNKLRYSKDDVAEALNHTDDLTMVTDIYISKDWSLIDEIQRKLINLLSLPPIV